MNDRNISCYWINPDGLIVNQFNDEEYSSLPAYKETKVWERCCPGCGKHQSYGSKDDVKRGYHYYCDDCSRAIEQNFKLLNKNKGYRKVKVKYRRFMKYDYYNEELGALIPKFEVAE